jgi:hypothetical protein
MQFQPSRSHAQSVQRKEYSLAGERNAAVQADKISWAQVAIRQGLAACRGHALQISVNHRRHTLQENW